MMAPIIEDDKRLSYDSPRLSNIFEASPVAIYSPGCFPCYPSLSQEVDSNNITRANVAATRNKFSTMTNWLGSLWQRSIDTHLDQSVTVASPSNSINPLVAANQTIPSDSPRSIRMLTPLETSVRSYGLILVGICIAVGMVLYLTRRVRKMKKLQEKEAEEGLQTVDVAEIVNGR